MSCKNFILFFLVCLIHFCSVSFDYEYEHLCTTVYCASIIAHFPRLNPFCTNLQHATPLFTAFNRLYDKPLINKKLIETKVNTLTSMQVHTCRYTSLFIRTAQSIQRQIITSIFMQRQARIVPSVLFISLCFVIPPPRMHKPECACTVSQSWIIAVISK